MYVWCMYGMRTLRQVGTYVHTNWPGRATYLVLCKYAKETLRDEASRRLAAAGVTKFNAEIHSDTIDQLDYARQDMYTMLSRIQNAEKTRRHYRKGGRYKARDPSDDAFEHHDHWVGGYILRTHEARGQVTISNLGKVRVAT